VLVATPPPHPPSGGRGAGAGELKCSFRCTILVVFPPLRECFDSLPWWFVKTVSVTVQDSQCISLRLVSCGLSIDRNFPCQTLKIRNVSLIVMGS
jgi:hypothetical protein